jgi:hypothetical protein
MAASFYFAATKSANLLPNIGLPRHKGLRMLQ